MTEAEAAPVEKTSLGQGVGRLMTAGAEAALRQFVSSELLAAGKVNLIALDAVMERFGKRWPNRREQVHEHVEGTLDRHLGSHAYRLRISDTDVMVCQPELSRLSGQAHCLRALREILQHFLGDGGEGEIGVYQVLRISSDEVQARRVDAAAAYAGEEEAEVHPVGEFLDGSAWVAAEISKPFLTADGRLVEVSCDLDVVQELKRGSAIGVRLSRQVVDQRSGQEVSPNELSKFSRNDQLRIDLATILLGLKRLCKHSGQNLVTIVPIFLLSVRNIDSRASIVKGLNEVRKFSALGVVCELCDIDGLPAVALHEVVSIAKPFSLFTVGRMSELTLADVRNIREAGLRGLSLAPPRAMTDAAFIGWAKRAVRLGRQAVRAVLLYELDGARQRQLAAAVGATHASLMRPDLRWRRPGDGSVALRLRR